MKENDDLIDDQLKATQVGLSTEDKTALMNLAKKNERTLSAQIRYVIKLMIEEKDNGHK